MEGNELVNNKELYEGKNVLDLTSAETMLSLSGLSSAQQRTLTQDLASRMMAAKQKQSDLSLSLQGMNMKLNTLTDTASKAIDAGIDFTVKNTQNDCSGKTEVLMGNSACARRGTLIPTPSLQLLLMGAGIVVFLYLASMFLTRPGGAVQSEYYDAVPLSYTMKR